MRLISKEAQEACALRPGCSVLAALSGGADSVALLHSLRDLQLEGGIGRLFAAHLNHGIRGAEADADAEFCKRLCRDLDVPFFSERVDAPKYREDRRLSLEQAARELRYEFLYRIKAETGAELIALAHNRGDQAETVLMHLLRGSGLSGLCGMQYRRKDLVRPLLGVSRERIIGYLAELGQDYCHDSTNDERDALRNRIRLDLMPRLTLLNPRAEEAIAGATELLLTDELYLERVAAQADIDCRMSVDKLAALDRAILARVLKNRLAALTGDYERGDIERIIELLKGRSAGVATIRNGVSAWIDNGTLRLGALPKAGEYRFSHRIGETTQTPRGSLSSEVTERANIPCLGDEAFVDRSKLCGELMVRSRRDGDRFVPFGGCGTKLLSDYLIDRKTSRFLRDMPLVCDEAGIVYVAGHTIADRVRVDERTKEIVHFIFKEA
ncbi:MAG: tRNA lysidine(34) synthetase TilS [Clostridia bacterium]|nr:tRNA lysidine(34) synthetase TilS [Clostridia bacterium]